MNILVTDFDHSGDDVMIFTDKLTPDQVEHKLSMKGLFYCECYEVPDDELQYYIYEPCHI